MTDETHRTRQTTICRICHNSCSLVVETGAGRPAKVYGDKNNRATRGFSCIKGRHMLDYPAMPSRLLTSMKRIGDRWQPIGSGEAVVEIASTLERIVKESGPRSVATFCGTFGFINLVSCAFHRAFFAALKSPMFFTPGPIDQPGKLIADALHGSWKAGWLKNPDTIDVAMILGQNPLISLGGAFGAAPAGNIVAAKRRGLKLIVVDPRRTETAELADLHLQPRAGVDAIMLAGMARTILEEDMIDHEFLSTHAAHLDRLREAVAPFTPSFVAEQVGVPAEDLIAAARLYGSAKKGMIICGTGPNMAPHGTLTEYLCRVIATLCGHYPRAGEKVDNPGVLFRPPTEHVAATDGPRPGWGFGEKLRVHGLTDTAAGMPTAALPDEIILPGEGKVRALIVVGGNPLLCFPDQNKTFAALKDLDLLVCIDPKMSATAELAHYVIAPTLPSEVPALSWYNDFLGTWRMLWGYDEPYGQYTPALLDPPEGSDLMEEWQFFARLARAMDLDLTIAPLPYTNPDEAAALARTFDESSCNDSEDVLDLLFEGSPVPLSEVRSLGRNGHVFDVPEQVIQPPPEGHVGRFELGHPEMMAILAALAVANPPIAENPDFPLTLISRRLRDVYNSNWHDLEVLRRQYRCNPAFMNPADMSRLGIADGDAIAITSDESRIKAIAKAAPDVRPGCVSMAHGWGGNPDQPEDPLEVGGNTSRLISSDRNCDPHSWMPRQSALPVRVAIDRTQVAI